VTHPPNHSQPPLQTHWEGYLPDEAATARLGALLAACIAPGMRIYLRGELGSGKTTLVRALLRGFGVDGVVKSPTYALVELYVVSSLHLYHFDFYRFIEPSEFGDAGVVDYFRDDDGICVVEWPERAGDALPRPDLDFTLAYAGAGRKVSVMAHTKAGERCLARCRNA
jgi:tRNA threonylcarbamoyladenosine biosynthesis protein TsaE